MSTLTGTRWVIFDEADALSARRNWPCCLERDAYLALDIQLWDRRPFCSTADQRAFSLQLCFLEVRDHLVGVVNDGEQILTRVARTDPPPHSAYNLT
jgi:hypothetical protein